MLEHKKLKFLYKKDQQSTNLLCFFCNDIPSQPHECSQCLAIMCRKCYIKNLNKQCRSSEDMDQHLLTQALPASKTIEEELLALRFICPNYQNGCKEKLNSIDFDQHIFECRYNYKHLLPAMYSCKKCFYYTNEELEFDNHDCITNLNQRISSLETQLMYQQFIFMRQNELLNSLMGRFDTVTSHMSTELQKVKQKIEKDKNYQCDNGHNLIWLSDPYYILKEHYCKICNKSKLCRFFCKICSYHYCCSCIGIDFSQELCPNNHKMVHKKIMVKSIVCDVCEKSLNKQIQGSYICEKCDFDVCQDCFLMVHKKILINKKN